MFFFSASLWLIYTILSQNSNLRTPCRFNEHWAKCDISDRKEQQCSSDVGNIQSKWGQFKATSVYSAYCLWIDGWLSINCFMTGQSDGMTARLSLFHATVIITVLVTLFDWQVIYGKMQCWNTTAMNVCIKDGDKKENLNNRQQHTTSYTIKKKELTIVYRCYAYINHSFQCVPYTVEISHSKFTVNVHFEMTDFLKSPNKLKLRKPLTVKI